MSSFALASQEFVVVNRGLSSAYLCSLSREARLHPRESCTSRRLTPWARSAPTPGPASTRRGTYSKPVSVEMGGLGTTDHVTAQASTNQTDTFDNAEAKPPGPSLHPPFHTVGKARGFQAAAEKTGSDLGPPRSLVASVGCYPVSA